MRDTPSPPSRRPGSWRARAMNEVLTADEREHLLTAAELMQRLVEAGGGVAVVEP